MSTRPKFECHITIQSDGNVEQIEKIVLSWGWTFSYIQNDPDLGKNAFCYATHWFDSQEKAIEETLRMSVGLEANEGLAVVRAKVERVVFDSRKINGIWTVITQ